MPITVKHGEQDLSAIAALAVLMGIGQAKVPQLPDFPNVGSSGGGGGGGGRIRGLQGSAFGERTPATLTAPTQGQAVREVAHQKQLQEQFSMPAQLEEMRQKAVVDAEQFETKYTVKQKHDLAKLSNARQAIASSPNYSEEEKQAAFRAIDMQSFGIKPSAVPSDRPKPPDWVNPMGVSVEPTTGLHGTLETRNGQTSFKPIAKELQPGWQEIELKKAQATAQQKAMEKRDEFESKLWTTKVPVYGKNEITGKQEKTGERMMNKGEVNAILDERFGKQQQPAAPPEQQQAAQQDQKQPAEWWGGLESQGIKVMEGERRLPQEVGTASALYRAYRDKYGSYAKVPKELQPAFREAHSIIERYYGQRSSAQ